jgi:crotonobetainyl-CoA:carnitine CoA-transferase CaiB-like acyl-CoA transferase
VEKPLEGIVVIDFSQFLSGPSATLRLADLGARVIKIERPDGGDICRSLYISNLEMDGDSTLFHSINRNKQSFSANLKEEADIEIIKKLIAKADVVIQNFRPGVMERLGLDYESVCEINPQIIYGEITGYGAEGPWRDAPGQDLLVQSLSGMAWLNGDKDQNPVPFGLSIVDMMTGAHLVQGVLACLLQRSISGKGGKVEVSLLESILDFQFEVLTTYLQDGNELPVRSAINGAHAYLSAPYGIYACSDGYLALAMGSIPKLGELLDCPALGSYTNPESWSNQRDEIKAILVDHLKTKKTSEWLSVLEPADIWCAEVLTWNQLVQHEGFKVLQMTQEVFRENGKGLITTRCPIRIDGEILTSTVGSPRIGEHNEKILKDMGVLHNGKPS